MTLIRAQVRIPSFNQVPADVITNTWHFQSVETDISEAYDDILVMLEDFYESCYATGAGGTHMLWASSQIWFYDMEAPTPRVPEIRSFPLTVAGSNASLPAEVAIVVSYAGDPFSGIPQARRRGRIYLGGLANVLQTGSASSYPTVSSAITTRFALAGAALITASAGPTKWSVFSPTQEAVVPLSGWTLVTSGFVGNEFDSQRRRGPEQTVRTTFT